MGGWMDKSKELQIRPYGISFEPIQEDVGTIKGAGNVGAFINFNTCENDTILVRSAISMVSTENAWLNLEKEITAPFGWNFEEVAQKQVNIWNQYLGRIEIETDDYLQKVKFYTNLYRAFSGRVAWGDVNGQWVDMNEEVQTFEDPNQRLCSGEFWNTFWNVQQLYQLVAPGFSSMQVKSLIEFYEKGGWLSKGIFGGEYSSVMVAEHGIPWIVGAWDAGIRDFDFNKAYEAMYHVQTTPPLNSHSGGSRVGNESLVSYMKYGYVPLNDKVYQSYVSNTLEYAFDDWCLAQAAKVLGKNDDYELFIKRSQNWRNIFDPESGFMRPKNADGSWYEPFNPYHTPGFVEGNSWQFSWFVPHDMKGLIKAIGKKRFISRLDSAMQKSQKVNFNALGDNFSKYPINHGNQPNMQSCYLFNYAGAPWLTQKWARAIQEKYYGTGPRDAYPGDEDQGQMSAWYVMSSIGLFQMEGGASTNPYYELGSPRFEKISIHLSNKYYSGKTFVIEAKNASRENKYIHAVILNGKKLNSWRFPQKELVKGGKIVLEMKNYPNKTKLK
jgi:predicted alpha-1,2-mannosidase